jgi:YVTN family beta-propeller protein
MLMAGAAAALLLASGGVFAATLEKSVKAAPGLYEVVFNPADGDIYVASTGTRDGSAKAKIVRLDGVTLAPEGEIDVAANPLFGLGLNSRTQILYGTDTRGGTVSAIDLKTGKVVAHVKEGERAHVREVVVDEAANKAYVSVVGGGEGRGADAATVPSFIWVIDGATNAIERVITVPAARQLLGLALDPAGQRLFGTSMGGGDIIVVDLKTSTVKARWPVNAERPTNIVYDAPGKRLFVANQGGSLSVLNADTGAVIKVVPTGQGALSVAYNPARNQVYVANRMAGTLSVIDGRTYAVTASPAIGTLPQTIALNRAGDRVYVTNKARGLPRGSAPGTAVPDDPGGDTVTLLRP